MAHDVFICHSTLDRTVADAVCDALEAKGIKCWIAPRDITKRSRWVEAVIDAIDDSRLVVLVLSAASNDSEDVLAEMRRATKRRISKLPFRIEDVRLSKSMDYYIGSLQWIDALPSPTQEHFEKLALEVQRCLINDLAVSDDEKRATEIEPRPIVDVYIAHVDEDADIALEIALYLEKAGYSTWCYEVDSISGPSYRMQTREAVEQSRAVVVVISSHSKDSSEVTREVVAADESNKELIPILREVTYSDFENRQPIWRRAIGVAKFLSVTPAGSTSIIGGLINCLRAQEIQPESGHRSSRIEQIRTALEAKQAGGKPEAGSLNED
jgi:hypothetical protein